jgi:hypothetical protein
MTLAHSRPLLLPPDALLKSYLNLIHHVFVDLRSSARLGDRQAEYATDLADAMHNISFLIAAYDDGYLNDERFRRGHLRPFDRKWKTDENAIARLERELDDFAREVAPQI